jgi:hypothetical protein
MKIFDSAGTVKPTDSDLKYGYVVGVDGLMRIEEVLNLMSIGRTTVGERCRKGIYRKVRDRGIVRICRRSVMEHNQRGEIGPDSTLEDIKQES